MSDEPKKHGIQKRHTLATDEEKAELDARQSQIQEKLLKDFKWEDDEESSGFKIQEAWTTEEIVAGIADIVTYVAANMSLMHYDEARWSLVVPIPQDLTKVISERFNNVYELDSRLEQIDRVRESFQDVALHSDLKSKLDDKILELFPSVGLVGNQPTNSPVGRWEISDAHLDDDADLIVGIVGATEEAQSPITVTLELSKSAV